MSKGKCWEPVGAAPWVPVRCCLPRCLHARARALPSPAGWGPKRAKNAQLPLKFSVTETRGERQISAPCTPWARLLPQLRAQAGSPRLANYAGDALSAHEYFSRSRGGFLAFPGHGGAFAGSVAAGHGCCWHQACQQPGSHPNLQPEPFAPRFWVYGGVLAPLGIAVFSFGTTAQGCVSAGGDFPRVKETFPGARTPSQSRLLLNIPGICLLHPPGWGSDQESPLFPKDFPLPWGLYPKAVPCLSPQGCWRSLGWEISSPQDSHGQIYGREALGRGSEKAEN